ncbi:MAG: hypothetical protein M3340_05530 [Actinomycetota bacterium]|nr:hypothetical protein [Actinomycetota bacterium]
MEYDERADELEQEAERLEHESKRLDERTEGARSEWESRKSDPSGAPGATSEEAAGPHNVDDPDPATGRNYGDERRAEIEDAEAADAEDE